MIFLLISMIHYNRQKQYKVQKEYFASNEWTTNKDKLAEEKAPLNDVQKTEVENMIKSISSNTVKTMVSSQSSSLAGPPGPVGERGPAGGQYIATGRLINKAASLTKTDGNPNYFSPEFALSRSSGTNVTSSLAFMDIVSPFASNQNWELDVNNNIKNRFDETCLSINPSIKDGEESKIYMDKCDTNNQNQKWRWDSSNRLISTSSSTSKILKCLGLSQPEKNLITSVPNCVGDKCMNNNVDKKYLIVKNCEINKINDDEQWSFI